MMEVDCSYSPPTTAHRRFLLPRRHLPTTTRTIIFKVPLENPALPLPGRWRQELSEKPPSTKCKCSCSLKNLRPRTVAAQRKTTIRDGDVEDLVSKNLSQCQGAILCGAEGASIASAPDGYTPPNPPRRTRRGYHCTTRTCTACSRNKTEVPLSLQLPGCG